ncbi:hypothetical protein L249_2094 [Ophiocordyceps polyrhachis-furcata BCC 54312]|uniref:Uncharacterized protein n=1 Tax=Ophiocordyceps polyrhachis-furcata BCC 54312 TaxID=1330021 RepID=A0A367LSK7_9HYPO|nr:hypothetical protein L249_2094 [Ophiocordyceps polyrhachis-furcata BCC 54312]
MDQVMVIGVTVAVDNSTWQGLTDDKISTALKPIETILQAGKRGGGRGADVRSHGEFNGQQDKSDDGSIIVGVGVGVGLREEGVQYHLHCTVLGRMSLQDSANEQEKGGGTAASLYGIPVQPDGTDLSKQPSSHRSYFTTTKETKPFLMSTLQQDICTRLIGDLTKERNYGSASFLFFLDQCRSVLISSGPQAKKKKKKEGTSRPCRRGLRRRETWQKQWLSGRQKFRKRV